MANPAQRLSITQIRQHPWFTKDLPPNVSQKPGGCAQVPGGTAARWLCTRERCPAINARRICLPLPLPVGVVAVLVATVCAHLHAFDEACINPGLPCPSTPPCVQLADGGFAEALAAPVPVQSVEDIVAVISLARQPLGPQRGFGGGGGGVGGSAADASGEDFVEDDFLLADDDIMEGS